jgi:hypothetical protein
MADRSNDSMSLALKYNLHIVRCAYEVKRALSLVADPQVGVALSRQCWPSPIGQADP